MKLTDLALKKLIKAGNPTAKSDGGGLTFCLSKSGTASWILRYRMAGKPRELTLGRYPDISLAEARIRASSERGKIQGGLDVAREKQETLRRQAAAQTVRDLVEHWRVKVLPLLAPNTIRHRERHLRSYILPRLGKMDVEAVTPRDVVDLYRHVGSKSTENTAILCSTTLKALFKHAMAQSLIVQNPCTGIEVEAVVGKPPPPKTRLMLTDAEISTLLQNLHRMAGRENQLSIRILLATAVRHSELFGAKWADVDFENALWKIPISKTSRKTGTIFVQPLAPQVVEWFTEMKKLAGDSELVQPARMRGKSGKTVNFGTLRLAIDPLCEEIGIRRFSPHDLRSTCRSHLSALGVNVLVAEVCLNHSIGGAMRKIYDQHDFLDERRIALTAWADKLSELEWTQERPKNVIQWSEKSKLKQ